MRRLPRRIYETEGQQLELGLRLMLVWLSKWFPESGDENCGEVGEWVRHEHTGHTPLPGLSSTQPNSHAEDEIN